MTTLCGFIRNRQAVLSCDHRTVDGSLILEDSLSKSETFEHGGKTWFTCSSGSSSIGMRMRKLVKECVENNIPLLDFQDFIYPKIREYVSFREDLGEPRTQKSSTLFSDGYNLFELDGDLSAYRRTSCFKGSGGDIALGVFEALRNTKISNKVLLERVYGIVGVLDCYTSPKFTSNLG